ncbi:MULTISPECIES: hypothetical protein, partial [unclassified Rhizobium]|uniref:hypothetical protein n=1 Tax=unclassified Rhizobium TaxID=2613769 RepID=UPI0025ECF825
ESIIDQKARLTAALLTFFFLKSCCHFSMQPKDISAADEYADHAISAVLSDGPGCLPLPCA